MPWGICGSTPRIRIAGTVPASNRSALLLLIFIGFDVNSANRRVSLFHGRGVRILEAEFQVRPSETFTPCPRSGSPRSDHFVRLCLCTERLASVRPRSRRNALFFNSPDYAQQRRAT